MRVVIDANIVVSFLLSKGDTISFLFDQWEKETFEVLTSSGILEELYDVIDRVVRSTKGGVDQLEAAAMRRRLKINTTRILIVSSVHESRDDKDNKYLACAKDGQADYLVSGDKDLLSLNKFGTTRIVSPKEFVEELQKGI